MFTVMTMWEDEKIKDMDTSDTPWYWHYLADCGKWHKVEDDPDNFPKSEDIEKFYQTNPKGVLSTRTASSHSKIDFSAMLQTDVNTGELRKIQRGPNIERSCGCYTPAPVFWEKINPASPYQLIPLSEATPEYKCVASYVKNTGLLDKSIVSISRIQNLDLWEIFCRKKIQLRRIQGVKKIKERRLFHGTAFENVDNICKYNFDLRLAGQNGHKYGRGIYFAKYASYADKYSKISTDPLPLYDVETRVSSEYTKVIFLARVIIGESTFGQQDFIKPDHGSLENTHYSCVDDIQHPKIFVVFDPNQIYPEYLIQYKPV